MRKLAPIVIVFVVAVAGIALAQQPVPPWRVEQQIGAIRRPAQAGPQQCVKFDGTTYSVNETTTHFGHTYRCSAVYDQWMIKTSGVAWVQVTP